MPLKCIVIDDIEEAIKLVVDHIKKIPELILVDTFTDPLDALLFLETNNIDLVFIDVKMPHLNGIEFIETLRAKRGNKIPTFVVTSGYDQYALSGFEQGAVDYLLKPIGFKRFKTSIERILERNTPGYNNNLSKEHFFVESKGEKLKLTYKSIAYIESSGNYVTVVEDKAKRLIYTSMHSMENLLNKDFVRVHKSFIISEHYIASVRSTQIFLNVSGDIVIIPIGRSYKNNVLRLFENPSY